MNANANTSATRPDSSAFRLNPDNMLDVISAVKPKSVCPAAAKDNNPGIVSIISFVLKPAIAR